MNKSYQRKLSRCGYLSCLVVSLWDTGPTPSAGTCHPSLQPLRPAVALGEETTAPFAKLG